MTTRRWTEAGTTWFAIGDVAPERTRVGMVPGRQYRSAGRAHRARRHRSCLLRPGRRQDWSLTPWRLADCTNYGRPRDCQVSASGGSVTRSEPATHGDSTTVKPTADRMSRYLCRSRSLLLRTQGNPSPEWHLTATHPPFGSPSTRNPRRPGSASRKPSLRSNNRTRAAAALTSMHNEYH